MHARLILFDLGGVLASLGRPAEQMELGIANDDFWSVWLGSQTVAEFETGVIDELEFFRRFPHELGLSDSPKEFRRRFLQWRLELFPDVVDLLRELGESRDIALLSNTNPVHWNMVDPDGGFRELFDYVFLSFEIGHAKPHRNIFDQVLDAVPHNPGDILFLDDTAKNVDAAMTAGIRASQVTGIKAASRALGRRDNT